MKYLKLLEGLKSSQKYQIDYANKIIDIIKKLSIPITIQKAIPIIAKEEAKFVKFIPLVGKLVIGK